MKKIIFVILFLFIGLSFSQPASAKNQQAIFTPSASTVIFLNCYASDKSIIKKYQELKKAMLKKWSEEKNVNTDIFYTQVYPFTRQIINVYVGGIKRINKTFYSLPNSNFITSYYKHELFQSLVNIENPQKTIESIEKIIR